MALVQIGAPSTQATVTVREMFERLAQREAEMVRSARRRAGVACSADGGRDSELS